MRVKALSIAFTVILGLLALAPAADAIAPANTALPHVSGVASVGVTLTVSTGGWTPTPTQYSYAWWNCVPSGNGRCIPHNVATTASYKVQGSDVTATVYVFVRAGNANGEWSDAVEADNVIGPIAKAGTPINTLPPTASGPALVGATLTATAGSWTNADSVTLQWYECNPSMDNGCDLDNATAIDGANATTYVTTGGDTDNDLFVTAVGHNGSGDATPVMSDLIGPITAPEGSTPPNNVDVPQITGTPKVGSRLSASAGDWDVRPDQYTYEWRTCAVPVVTPGDARHPACIQVTGATGSTYVPSAADLGKLIEVGVTAHNQAGWSDETFSDTVGPITAAGSVVVPAHQQRPQVTTAGKISTRSSGKSFVVAPAVRVSCPSGGSSCTVDMLAKTRVRTTKHRKLVWQTLTVAHVHLTLSAGKTSTPTFRLTGQGASLLVRKQTLSVTVTTRATATGVAAVTLVKTIAIHRPKIARRRTR